MKIQLAFIAAITAASFSPMAVVAQDMDSTVTAINVRQR